MVLSKSSPLKGVCLGMLSKSLLLSSPGDRLLAVHTSRRAKRRFASGRHIVLFLEAVLLHCPTLTLLVLFPNMEL